jgi:hypothetical protein
VTDPCPHDDFHANVDVTVVTDEDGGPRTGLLWEVRAECVRCGAPVVFHCPDLGLLADRPTVSVDGQALRLPARLATDPEDFGLQLPGFSLRVERPPSDN